MRESTAHYSGPYTSRILRPLFTWLFGPISDPVWYGVHYYIRKTGHFTGYGLTGLAFMRGWRWQWHHYFFGQTLKRRAGQMAVCCTAVVASCDELHQSYLASRTGLMSDVLLDTCGAGAMIAIAIFWSRSRWRSDRVIEWLAPGKPG